MPNPNQIIEALIPQQDTRNHLKSVAVGEGPGVLQSGLSGWRSLSANYCKGSHGELAIRYCQQRLWLIAIMSAAKGSKSHREETYGAVPTRFIRFPALVKEAYKSPES